MLSSRRNRPLWAALLLCLMVLTPAVATAGGRVAGQKRAAARKNSGDARRARPRRAPSAATAKAQGRAQQKLAEARRRQKFDRVHKFGARIGGLRKQVDRDLSQPGVSFDRAIAAVVRIMDAGYVRIGSHRFSDPRVVASKQKAIATYGALSLRKDQVKVDGDTVRFDFIGKSSKKPVRWKFSLRDPPLAAAIRTFKAQKSNQPQLFQVPVGGETRVVTEQRVRTVLERYGGKPKDLRTLHANRIVRETLASTKPAETVEGRKKQIRKAIDVAARALNHEPNTSRASYIEAELIQRFERSGTLGARGPPR